MATGAPEWGALIVVPRSSLAASPTRPAVVPLPRGERHRNAGAAAPAVRQHEHAAGQRQIVVDVTLVAAR